MVNITEPPNVFPACAGVILKNKLWELEGYGLSRMRGGDPNLCYIYSDNKESFPHARG